MKIFIGTDHAGFELKQKIVAFLIAEKYEVIDKGAVEFKDGDDYPDYISAVAREIQKDPESRGIIFGGSGQGEAISANRFLGVRASLYYGGSKEIITLSREHNDANVLSLAGRFLSEDEAKSAVKLWLETPFSGEERHLRRIKKIDECAR